MKKLSELYAPKSQGAKAFVKKHTDAAAAPMKNDEPTKDDKVFKATNIKTYDRSSHRHGYNPGDDEKAYGVGGDVGVNDQRPETGIAPYTVKEEEEEYLDHDEVVEMLFGILDDMLGEDLNETSGRDFARGVNPNHPATTIKNPEKHPHYSAVAVQKEIDRHNRRPRGGRISKKEAAMIHRLLRGRD